MNMNHVVEITCPSDDRVPDFLCNDTTNVDALPDDVIPAMATCTR